MNISPDLFKNHLWYIELQLLIQKYFLDYKGKIEDPRSEAWLQEREEFVRMIAELIATKNISLGESGPNLDIERIPITTLVIHHSATSSDTSYEAINTLHLLRLYAPVYWNPRNPKYELPLWSGHFLNGAQTFVGYHYLIWQDGTVVHALQDEHIGWHAGNWEVNKKSIGICFVDDLTEKEPTQAALLAAIKIIEKYPNTYVVGHNEVISHTRCPGNRFLGPMGWKDKLKGKADLLRNPE